MSIQLDIQTESQVKWRSMVVIIRILVVHKDVKYNLLVFHYSNVGLCDFSSFTFHCYRNPHHLSTPAKKNITESDELITK